MVPLVWVQHHKIPAAALLACGLINRALHRGRPLIFPVYLFRAVLFCVLHKCQKDRNPTAVVSFRLEIRISMID